MEWSQPSATSSSGQRELSFLQTKPPCGEIYSLEMGFAVLSEALLFLLESGICKMFGETEKSQNGRRRIGPDANEHLEEEEEEVHMTVDPKAEA